MLYTFSILERDLVEEVVTPASHVCDVLLKITSTDIDRHLLGSRGN